MYGKKCYVGTLNMQFVYSNGEKVYEVYYVRNVLNTLRKVDGRDNIGYSGLLL